MCHVSEGLVGKGRVSQMDRYIIRWCWWIWQKPDNPKWTDQWLPFNLNWPMTALQCGLTNDSPSLPGRSWMVWSWRRRSCTSLLMTPSVLRGALASCWVSEHMDTWITLFILRAKRPSCRLPPVWQRMPSTPHCSTVLIHSTCLGRQRT